MHRPIIGRILTYGGVTALSQFANFSVLGLYSRWLPPDDYGTYSLATSVIALGAALFTFGLLPAFFRYFPKHQSIVSTTVFSFVVASLLAVTIVTFVFRDALAPVALGDNYSPTLFWIMFAALTLETLLLVPMTQLRAEERSTRYASTLVAKTATMFLLGTVLVGLLDFGVLGAVSALALGSMAGLLVSLSAIRLTIMSFDLQLLKKMLVFGLPIQPSILLNWGLTYADRYLLVYFISVAALAPYSAAVMLVSGVNGFLQAGFSLLWPPVMYRIAERKDARQAFGSIATGMIALFFWVNLSLSMLGEHALEVFAPAYVEASNYLPLIGLGYALYSPFIFVNSALQIGNATKWILFAVFMGVVVNVAANLLLIPSYGSTGSALGAVIGYSVLTGIGLPQAQRIYPIDYPWNRLMILMGTGMLAFLLHLLEPNVTFSLLLIFGYALVAVFTTAQGHNVRVLTIVRFAVPQIPSRALLSPQGKMDGKALRKGKDSGD